MVNYLINIVINFQGNLEYDVKTKPDLGLTDFVGFGSTNSLKLVNNNENLRSKEDEIVIFSSLLNRFTSVIKKNLLLPYCNSSIL